MSKSNRYSDGEVRLIQRLKHENGKLKRQIKALRKQLDRVDLDRYHNLKDLVDKQYEEDKLEHEAEKKAREQEANKGKWLCHSCQQDILRIVILTRRDGEFYFRRCNHCGNKTKLQKYTKDVEGIRADDEEAKS